MTTPAGWAQTPGGIAFDPSKLPPTPASMTPGEYPPELVQQVRSEFATIIATLQEAELQENAINDWNYSGDTLGVGEWTAEQAIGEGYRGRFQDPESMMSYLADILYRTYYGMQGGQLGVGYGIYGGGDMQYALTNMLRIMWMFPVFNPLAKQLVEIRSLYVFGQGYEIKAESKKQKREKMLANKEKHDLAVQQRQLMQQQAMQMTGMTPPGQNGAQNGQDANGMMRNGLYQGYGETGRANSMPRRAARQESLREARSPAAGGQQGAREPSGGRFGPLENTLEEQSPIAKAVREFFEDPCSKDRLTSVEALQRLDKQCVIEGNAYVVLHNRGKGEMPACTVWPTHAIAMNVVDDLSDGTGVEVGYVVSQISQNPEDSDKTQKVAIPSMLSNDVNRLEQVLNKHKLGNIKIDDTKRVYHVKEWGPTWRHYGTPGLMASVNFAVRYASFTSEWAIMQRVMRTYMMVVTGYGNNKGLNRVHADFANRMASRTGVPQNESGLQGGGPLITPPPAMTLLTGMSPSGMPGTRIEPIRTAGSTDPPAMGRELKLMAAVGMGYPDNMLSDTSSGTMAQSTVLERNTHLKFLSAQNAYGDMLKCIARMVVEMQLGAEQVQDMDVTVSFPSIITPSVAEQAGTLIQLYQSDGIPKRILVEEALKMLKRGDVEDILGMLFPGDGDGMELKSDADLDQAQNAGMTPFGAPGTEPSDVNNPLAAIGEEWLEDHVSGGEVMFYG